MKRSITCVAWTLGSAALVALATGCSHENRTAQTPAAGGPSPTFESNVPPEQQGKEPATATPAPPAAEQPAPAPGAPPAPQGEMGNKEHAGEAPMTAPTGDNERQACDALASAAKLKVDDVPNGVAIVATPRAGHDVAAVRDDAHRIDTMMHQRGATEGGPTGEACGLFSIARLPGVNTTITDGANSSRIVMTTPNPAEVKDLRRIAREQVNALTKNKR